MEKLKLCIEVASTVKVLVENVLMVTPSGYVIYWLALNFKVFNLFFRRERLFVFAQLIIATKTETVLVALQLSMEFVICTYFSQYFHILLWNRKCVNCSLFEIFCCKKSGSSEWHKRVVRNKTKHYSQARIALKWTPLSTMVFHMYESKYSKASKMKNWYNVSKCLRLGKF